jgi:hypothetical protein
MFAHHIVVKASSFIDAKQTADSSCDAANHAPDHTAYRSAGGTTFGGAAFRTAWRGSRLADGGALGRPLRRR